MELYEKCSKEFLMLLYERLCLEIDEMRGGIYKERHELEREPYWEGMCDGISRSLAVIEDVFRELASG